MFNLIFSLFLTLKFKFLLLNNSIIYCNETTDSDFDSGNDFKQLCY